MSYIKAEEILPEEVLAIVQEYVDGQMLYIPRKPEHKRRWGACTGTKQSLELRNTNIYAKFQDGASAKDLAEEYFLTEKSVQRIIRNFKPSQDNCNEKNHLSEVEN